MIEQRFNYFLTLTSDPQAAATLVLAEVTAAQQPEGALTVKQAADRLNCSTDLVRDLIDDGKLRAQRIGRAIRIRPADVADYLSGIKRRKSA